MDNEQGWLIGSKIFCGRSRLKHSEMDYFKLLLNKAQAMPVEYYNTKISSKICIR